MTNKQWIISLGDGLYLDGIEGEGEPEDKDYWQTTENRRTAWRFDFNQAHKRVEKVRKAFPDAKVESLTPYR